jgi:tRNA pseudouridine38/39 synthase
MRNAAVKLLGEHDFRNLSHINKSHADGSYVRRMDSIELDGDNKDAPYSLLQLRVQASGFLWHQSRCIVTLLYLIGLGKEEPEVGAQLSLRGPTMAEKGPTSAN